MATEGLAATKGRALVTEPLLASVCILAIVRYTNQQPYTRSAWHKSPQQPSTNYALLMTCVPETELLATTLLCLHP